MSAITAAEREERGQLALGIIAKFIETNGYPPSRREISEALGLASKTSAQKLVERLAGEGLLEVVPGRAGGLRITKAGMKQARQVI